VTDARPQGWHCLELDLLDPLALSRRLYRWLEATPGWTDGRRRAELLLGAASVARAIGLALAEPCPRYQQDYVLVASGRAELLRGPMEKLKPSEDLAQWVELVDDLCEALELAGLQRLGNPPPSGDGISS
jgi:hypothetical protein